MGSSSGEEDGDTQPMDVDIDDDGSRQREKPADKENGENEFRDEDGGIRIDDIYIPPPPPPALTFESDKPRLIITHIENENFKSYAGLQVLGPFHKSFTSIVGPNGSGKSNVIDSMLFVFGYRAQKIRSKKISVLIHNSERHKDVQSCKVKVHFQDIIDLKGIGGGGGEADPDGDADGCDEGYRSVPGSEFTVARTAFRDNSSHYEIDGRRCQFKDVARLLRRKGVDLDHNRFLILQGEVEQIALMKPKGSSQHDGSGGGGGGGGGGGNDTGMLEFLEDIVGSSRFKVPIETLHARVQELDEQRAEKLNRVKLVEKEKDALEKPRNEALDHLHKLNHFIRQKNLGQQHFIMTHEHKVESIKKKREEFGVSVKEVIEKLNALTTKKAEKEEKLKSKLAEMERLQKDKEETVENMKKHDLEDTKVREEMVSVNTKRKRAANLRQAEKDNCERLLKLPEVNAAKVAECETLKAKHEAQAEEEQDRYDRAVENLRKETQVFQDQKEKLETELIDFKKVENEKESRLNYAQSELDHLTSVEVREQCKLDQMDQKLITASDSLRNKSEELAGHEKAIPDLKTKGAKAESDLQGVAQEYDALSGRIRGLRSSYEETRSAQAATKSRGRVHDALMQQKRTGAISGIMGRLGDLGAIDKKYDVAVSTAAGSGLDTILVDSVDTAKRCIEYLKANDVGRANFLAHDKTARWRDKVGGHSGKAFRAPEGVSRLVDLIQVEDESIKTAFYQYLRDTLVADDLDQAQRIGYGTTRYRVVTLNGEVIETSGSMSGGGNQKVQGKMGTQIQQRRSSVGGEEADIRTLERNLQREEQKLSDISEQKNCLEQTAYKSRKELNEREAAVKRLRMEIATLGEECKLLQAHIKTQKDLVKAAKPDENELKAKKTAVESLKTEFDAAVESSREKREAVAKLNRKIKEVGGDKVKAAQHKLDGVRNQLDKVKKEITRLQVEAKQSERNLQKAKDKVEGYEAEVTEAETRMREMKVEREALEARGKEVMEKLNELKEAEAIGVERIKANRESIAKLEQEEKKFKSDRIEIDQVMEKFANSIKENTLAIQHFKREISKLRLEEIPGEEVEELKDYLNSGSEQDLKELQELDVEAWKYEQNQLEEELRRKRPDLKAIEEYGKKESVYLDRVAELEEITKRKEFQRKKHDDLRKMRLNEFMEGFGIITAKLKEMYQMITLGGDAELELVDSLDPFTEGIVFSVRPPKKSWKNISNLSGGEKTLSSLALVFALHYYKPTPLYVMDEIDAALDFKNVSIVANYIKERTKNAQFIIISLRSNMFELADRLVGIFKTYNCTKSVTINPGRLSSLPPTTISSQMPRTNGPLDQRTLVSSSVSVASQSSAVIANQKDKEAPDSIEPLSKKQPVVS